MATKGVGVRSDHFAHVLSLHAHGGGLLAALAVITSFLAPEGGRVVPLEGFLAGSVAHATVIVSIVSETRHICFIIIIN